MEYRDWLRNNTGMDLDAKFDEEPEPDTQQDSAMQNKVDELESKIRRLSTEQATHAKIQEMKETFDEKLSMLKEATVSKDNSLFKRREKVLEKLLAEVEKIG